MDNIYLIVILLVLVVIRKFIIMSDLFHKEQKRYWSQFDRIKKILKQHRKRYGNKTDVIVEALDLLEEKLANLKE